MVAYLGSILYFLVAVLRVAFEEAVGFISFVCDGVEAELPFHVIWLGDTEVLLGADSIHVVYIQIEQLRELLQVEVHITLFLPDCQGIEALL